MSDSKRRDIETSISKLEENRSILGDLVVDVAIESLKKYLAELKDQLVPHRQRKIMTIVFVDVVESTNLIAELDPEEKMQVMDNALQQLSIPIINNGGRVTRYMGDGFLAIYGYPIARENDPEIAVRSALEIISEAEKLDKKLQNDWGLDGFAVRIGINTGLVVTGGYTEAENTLMGNAVNLASRLEPLASPNGILISEFTYKHVQGLFKVISENEITVKGFDDPVKVFSIASRNYEINRSELRGIQGISTKILGRDAILQQLKEVVIHLFDEPRFKLVGLSGEAGIGKSKVLQELEKSLFGMQLVNLYIEGSIESRDIPFSFVRKLLINTFSITNDDDDSDIQNKIVKGLENLLGPNNELIANSSYLMELLGEGVKGKEDTASQPKQRKESAITYIINLLRELSQIRPIVILLDDLHWSDASSLGVVKRMQGELQNSSILAVFAGRPELLNREPWLAEMASQLINLGPLSHSASQKLIKQLLHKVEYLPSSFCNLITDNAGGNPYYIEELIKMLIDEGVIITKSDNWYIKIENITRLHVPVTLAGVLQARLDNLSSQERELIEIGALTGNSFWEDLISELITSIDQDKIPGILAQLEQKEFIAIADLSSIPTTKEYYFTNVILREVTYENILKQKRAEYHGLIANWLKMKADDCVGDNSNLIGYHLEASGDMDGAKQYYIQFAENAVSQYALGEASLYFNKAIDLLVNDPEKKFALLLARESVLNQLGERNAQAEVIQELKSLAKIMKDELKEIEVIVREALLSWWISDFRYMNDLTAQAIKMVEKHDDPRLNQQVEYVYAWNLLQLGQFKLSLTHSQKSLNYAEQLGDKSATGTIHNVIALALQGLGDFLSSIKHLEAFLDIAYEIEDIERISTALTNISIPYIRLGYYMKAKDYLLRHKNLLDQSGDVFGLSSGLINLAWVCACLEDWHSSLEYGKIAIRLKREGNHIDALAEGLLWMGHSYLAVGEFERARQSYEEALAKRLGMHQLNLAMGALAGMLRVARAQDRIDEANQICEEIVTYLEDNPLLEGTWEPIRIYHTCYIHLLEQKDPRADRILDLSFGILQYYMEMIPDQEIRNNYISSAKWRQEIHDLMMSS